MTCFFVEETEGIAKRVVTLVRAGSGSLQKDLVFKFAKCMDLSRQ